MTLVKICGICSARDAEAAIAGGADLLGMHFCDSPRRIELDLGRVIANASRGRVKLVGVFIDEDPARVDAVAGELGLDYVQLHGSEQPGHDYAAPVIKAIKVRDGSVADTRGWPDPLLLDSWTADGRGGTGRTWDWDLARPLAGTRQVFVAGGQNPENVGEVVRRLRPHGVDVSSGVEPQPRRKSPALIQAFVQAVRDADAS